MIYYSNSMPQNPLFLCTLGGRIVKKRRFLTFKMHFGGSNRIKSVTRFVTRYGIRTPNLTFIGKKRNVLKIKARLRG